jgi:uncharacterized protein (TIRG00374 family)
MLLISILLFYFFILPSLNFNEFLTSLRDTDILIYGLAVVSLLISNIFGSLRWSLLMKAVNATLSQKFSHALGTFCFGQVAGLIVPSRVGNYTKVPLVTKLDNISFESALAAVNAETLFDLIYIVCAGIVSIIILSAFLFSLNIAIPVFVILILFILAAVIISMFEISRFKSYLNNLVLVASDINQNMVVRIIATLTVKLCDLIQSTRVIFTDGKSVLRLSSFTLIMQLFGIAGLYLVLESVNSPLPIQEVFAILTISYIVGIASLIPGGLGASDLSLIALLVYDGIPLTIATNIAILWRIAMYLPVLAVVGIYFIQNNVINQKITGQ